MTILRRNPKNKDFKLNLNSYSFPYYNFALSPSCCTQCCCVYVYPPQQHTHSYPTGGSHPPQQQPPVNPSFLSYPLTPCPPPAPASSASLQYYYLNHRGHSGFTSGASPVAETQGHHHLNHSTNLAPSSNNKRLQIDNQQVMVS